MSVFFFHGSPDWKSPQTQWWKTELVFSLMHLCVGWGLRLTDPGLACWSLPWSCVLGPGVFHVSCPPCTSELPDTWSSHGWTVWAREEKDDASWAYAWRCYDATHTQLAKVSCIAESRTSAWEMDSAFIRNCRISCSFSNGELEIIMQIQYVYL